MATAIVRHLRAWNVLGLEQKMARKVFLSYSSSDKDIADRVCSVLEAAQISCWIAPRDIEPGVDYPAAIVEAINSCQVLVLILTKLAAASPHVLSEVGHAFNGKKRIIPFHLTSEPPPENLEYFLSMTQWLDSSDGCTDQNLKRLTEAISDPLAGRADPGATHTRERRTRLLAGVISVVVLAFGMILYWRSQRPHGSSGTPASFPATASPSGGSSTDPQPKIWVNPIDEQKYVWIAPGTFTMGCSPGDSECEDNEKPAHPVAIETGFWLGQTEVTITAYQRFAVRHALKPPSGEGTLPLTGLTWAKAKQYCSAIGGRLPTEAEWEFAARAGSSQAYYGMVPKIAWYAENSGDAPHAVGSKQPNAWGLYDMLGNVKEWVLDRYYKKYYSDSPATGANVDQPLAPNATAVVRGGFWGSDATYLRVSYRSEQENDSIDSSVGFRCAIDHP
jgi:formylglycine-generating enzyme required for sulfatase activity